MVNAADVNQFSQGDRRLRQHPPRGQGQRQGWGPRSLHEMAYAANGNQFLQGDRRLRQLPPRGQGQGSGPRSLQPGQIQCNVLLFYGKLCIVLPITACTSANIHRRSIATLSKVVHCITFFVCRSIATSSTSTDDINA